MVCPSIPPTDAKDWTSQIKVTPNDGVADDLFGYSVATSGDVLVVGAPLDDEGGSEGTPACSSFILCHNKPQTLFNSIKSCLTSLVGSVYIYELNHNTGNWDKTAELTTSDRLGYDNVGYVVGISGDVVVVSARYDDIGSDINRGSVYIFKKNTNTDIWEQKAKLLSSDGVGNDIFGEDVAIDRDNVVVGAPGDDPHGSESGSAYIFELNRNNDTWEQKAKLVPNDNYAGDLFGFSVAIYGDTPVVGAPYDDYDDDTYSNEGLYTYMKDKVQGAGCKSQSLLPVMEVMKTRSGWL